MAEKANDEVKNIPSEPIAKLPTLSESLTESEPSEVESESIEDDTDFSSDSGFIGSLGSRSKAEKEDKLYFRSFFRRRDLAVPEILDWSVLSIQRSMQSSFEAEDATKIYKPRDVDEELDPFLSSGKVKNIKTLIESGRLPSQRILDEMCQIFGRKSKAIIVTCKAICEYIKSKHVAIAYVWAAYTTENPQRITFVITVKHKSEGNKNKEPVRLEKLIQYSFVKQYAGDFSLEGSEVIKQQASHAAKLDEESHENLQTCISKHSEDLMKKHKYLSIISACSNRSKGFGASWELLPEKCIVLYVQKKNYIPIDEEPFETSYDGIPVDVREGVFIPYVDTASEMLNPVRMGCQIGGDSFSGTLGCFIDHPQYGVCGLTCAHVLLHSLELERLKSLGMMKWPLHGLPMNVYQPADNQSVFGNIVQLICKTGSRNTFGMDVALFRVTDRQPETASFPNATAISGINFYFSCISLYLVLFLISELC